MDLRSFLSGASATPPTAPTSPSSGYPTQGNPGASVPPTNPGAYWFHQLGEELRAVVVAGGLTPNRSVLTQLRDAISAMIAAALAPVPTPTGTVLHGYFLTAPAGYLLCNGALVSRATYAALWAHAQAQSGLVVSDVAWSASADARGRFSSGDGSTTFRLPDLRGEFIRGLDLSRGVDTGRTLGSWLADELRSHDHGGVPLMTPDVDRGDTASSSSFSIDNVGTTSAVGGAETRPRSVALSFVVKT